MASRPIGPKILLGEYEGNHSLVVYSAKGVDWFNVHPDLEKIMRKIHANDILDLSVGCEGQFYIRYTSGSTTEHRLTQETWKEIQPQFPGPLKRVIKLSFGFGDEIWAVRGGEAPRHFLRARERVLEIVQPQNSPHPAVNDIEFIAFGCCEDDFIIKIKGEVRVGNWVSACMSGIDQRHANKIVGAALSPVDASHYFILFDDGSYRAELHSALQRIVKRHMTSDVQFLPTETVEVAEARIELLLNPFDGLLIGPSFTTPAVSSISSTQLRILNHQDSSYWRIRRLFENGWMHPWKIRPQIRHIYEIQLPRNLLLSYLNYRLQVLGPTGWADHLERELFHGTVRRCALGDDPRYTNLCKDNTCRLCCILNTSFSTKMAGNAVERPSFTRFGQGIYTSTVSSKANDYSLAHPTSGYKAIIVARVVLGRGWSIQVTTPQLTGPPDGYDSVLGDVGAILNFDEQVVYKDEAIRPAYLIIY